MIIPFDDLEYDKSKTYHSDYQHVCIEVLPTSDDNSTYSITEIEHFLNLYDFVHQAPPLKYEVFMQTVIDENILPELPDGAISVTSGCEPNDDDTFSCFAV